VKGPAIGIMLKHEDRRASWIVGIVLYDHGLRNTCQHISGEKAILGKLVVAMVGNANLSPRNESLYRNQRVAHSYPPKA
jgi:hypothetical protein